jgi:hypothetical protein
VSRDRHPLRFPGLQIICKRAGTEGNKRSFEVVRQRRRNAVIGLAFAWGATMQALARLPRVRKGVVYLDSTYVPSDDSCFSRFEAESADDVRDVNEIAGVPFARIVAAAEIGVDLQRPADEGGSS